MGMEFIGFALMAAAALACAVGMLIAKNPIHAALWLVGNFVSLAVIYLLLSAPVLFAVQLIVYAGAIMVLFLFVIMFFMAPETRRWLNPPLRGQLTWGGLAAVALLLLLMFALGRSGEEVRSADWDKERQLQTGLVPDAARMGNPDELSTWLFSYQVLPFELTSILLLAALLGAVMIARDIAGEGRGKVVHRAAVRGTDGDKAGAAQRLIETGEPLDPQAVPEGASPGATSAAEATS